MPNEISWRQNPNFAGLFEAWIDGKMAAWIAHRPHYCDRGHWQAQVELNGIDGADAFPRYFMRFETARQELDDFLKWRLWRIPAPGYLIKPLVPAVHALMNGRPLCRFTSDLPKDWPEGQAWVGRDEMGKVTCPECTDLDRRIKAEEHGGEHKD